MTDYSTNVTRQLFIAGNWKMNTTCKEARNLADVLKGEIGNSTVRVAIIPPFTALTTVNAVIGSTSIELGAQNVSSEKGGAFTGEISCKMLTDTGVSVVIIGHSERRHVLGEQEGIISKKVKVALEAGIDIILCCGETLQEKEQDKAQSVVESQLRSALKNVTSTEVSSVTIAYEPVWAIGTGQTATVEDAEFMHQHIRSLVSEIFTEKMAHELRIQYGGSVKPDNAAELLSAPNIDGVLVGGASLDENSFLRIVDAATEHSR